MNCNFTSSSLIIRCLGTLVRQWKYWSRFWFQYIHLTCAHKTASFSENSMKVCPHCGSSRYKIDGKTACRCYTYLPLAPRFRRMFGTKVIHDLLTSHMNSNEEGASHQICDIHGSKIWNEEWFGESGEFRGNKNGIVLTLCLDGLNPFSLQKIANVPPRIRKTCAGILIAGIIPGIGTREPKSLEPYMEILVDELLALEECSMIDSEGDDIDISVKFIMLLTFLQLGKFFIYLVQQEVSGRAHFVQLWGRHVKHVIKRYFCKTVDFWIQCTPYGFSPKGMLMGGGTQATDNI